MTQHAQIAVLIRKLPKQDLTIVMGDLNAKVGKGRTGKHIEPWGLRERNEREEQLSVCGRTKDDHIKHVLPATTKKTTHLEVTDEYRG